MSDGIWEGIYVLVENRSLALINIFLDRFLPHRQEMASEYEVPQYSDNPEMLFKKASEVMELCEQNGSEVQAIYWTSTSGGEPRCAMVFYTSDGAMVLGLSTDDGSLEEPLLAQMIKFCRSSEGLINYEEPPPQTKVEFRRAVENATSH